MSATAINTFESGNDIILGKNLSAARRSLAFLSIVIVYFFYCYNFMVGTFVKPTMIAEAASGGFGFTLQQSETIFAVMSFGTIPGTIVFGILNAKIGKKYTLIVGVADCADHIPSHDDTWQLSGMAGVQADYRRYPGRCIRLRHASGDGTVSAEIPR